jgi:hypothetical protein
MYFIRTSLDGIERLTCLEQGVISYEDTAVALTDLQQELLMQLTAQPDTPHLATELRIGSELLADQSVQISEVFSGLKDQLVETGLSEHLIRIGKEGAGKSTHYGFMTEIDDENMLDFAHRGMYKLQKKRGSSGIQRRRQEAPFKALIKSIERKDEVETHTNRKLLAYGGAAIALTIGTASTVYIVVRSKDK